MLSKGYKNNIVNFRDNDKEMCFEEKAILEILKGCKGEENAIKQGEIATELMMLNCDITKRTIRNIISDLVTNDTTPDVIICSTANRKKGGYFIAEEKEEVQGCIKSLYSRAYKIIKRARALEDAVQKRWPKEEEKKQMKITFV